MKWIINCWILACALPALAGELKGGAAVAGIDPESFPVRVNAMFTERSADKVVDPLQAKALVLDDGRMRIAICVVDTCMMPRDLLDEAKARASGRTGIPVSRMLVSATHTHSAPSAMGCLGSRVDPRYAAFLPGRIVTAIEAAAARMEPVELGWAQTNLWGHTFNRRWIRRPDRLLADPFGQATVRAHMHPGHESPDAIGPSGPVDPELSLFALRRTNGELMAVFANFSQHYYGSELLSSDYFGRFAVHLQAALGASGGFVGMMSQGTSGDLMWMDYGNPRHEIGYDAYAREIAGAVAPLVGKMAWKKQASLRMAERTLALGYRTPGAERLAWARDVAAKLGNSPPKSQSEIYALEALYLHDRSRTEIKLQALRIGEIGIAAWPNEVFAISGMKVKRESPMPFTFNIELANGAEGYIPPPEQHRLGGYTTWPARTAGLEIGAEPLIVENLLGLLEDVAGRKRKRVRDSLAGYSRAVLSDHPVAYWRLEEMRPPVARDASGHGIHAEFEGGVAFWLPGASRSKGHPSAQPPAPNAFSGKEINRAAHFAGGRARAALSVGDRYTIELWLWNGLPGDARDVAGYFCELAGREATPWAEAGGVQNVILGIGGRASPEQIGKLFLTGGAFTDRVHTGVTRLGLRQWHHVVVVRDGTQMRVHLDGNLKPEISAAISSGPGRVTRRLIVGGRASGDFGFEGKLDEIAVYPSVLSPAAIARHFALAEE